MIAALSQTAEGFIIGAGVAWVVVWIALAELVGELAKQRGRNYLGWVVLGLVGFAVWPLIAVMCLGPTEAERERRIAQDERVRLAVRGFEGGR